jgi:SAM-dependent methyltransferase
MMGAVDVRTVPPMTTTDIPDTDRSADAEPGAGIDPSVVGAFAGRLMGLFSGGMLAYMVDIGHRTGLFDAAVAGPATSAELAGRAALDERYVREWLGAMVTGGIFDYEPTAATYRLPPEHAVCLAGASAMNMAPFSQMNTHLAKYVDAVVGAFRDGGGVPYAAYRPEFTDVMDGLGRGGYDGLLVDGVLPLAPGLAEGLAAGGRAADVACGTGHALVLLGKAFPASTFVGYDLDGEAVERARREAAEEGLTNVTFEVCDVAQLDVEQPFDAVFVFDAIHDQVDPVGVLDRIHAALRPGGTFLMKEPRVSSNLEDNVGNPFAPLLYSVSTLHCLTVSLAHGGAGLGTAFGEQVARRLLAEAGFVDLAVHEAPGDPIDAVYVSRRPIG